MQRTLLEYVGASQKMTRSQVLVNINMDLLQFVVWLPCPYSPCSVRSTSTEPLHSKAHLIPLILRRSSVTPKITSCAAAIQPTLSASGMPGMPSRSKGWLAMVRPSGTWSTRPWSRSWSPSRRTSAHEFMYHRQSSWLLFPAVKLSLRCLFIPGSLAGSSQRQSSWLYSVLSITGSQPGHAMAVNLAMR